MSDNIHPSNYPLTLSKLYRAINGGRASSVAELLHFGDKVIEGFKLIENTDYQIRNTSFKAKGQTAEFTKIRFNAPFFTKALYDRLAKNGIIIPENYLNYKYTNRKASVKDDLQGNLFNSNQLPEQKLTDTEMPRPVFTTPENVAGFLPLTPSQIELADLAQESIAESIEPNTANTEGQLNNPPIGVIQEALSQLREAIEQAKLSTQPTPLPSVIDVMQLMTERFDKVEQRCHEINLKVMVISQDFTRSRKREIAIEANVERLMTAYNDIASVVVKSSENNKLSMEAVQATFKDIGGALKGINTCLELIYNQVKQPVTATTNIINTPPAPTPSTTPEKPKTPDTAKTSLNYHKKINSFDAPTVIINNCMVFRDPSLAECVWDNEHCIYTLNLPKDFEPISWIIDRLNKLPDIALPVGGREFMRDYFFRGSNPANIKANREAVQHNRVVFSRYIQDFLLTNKYHYPNGIYIGLIYPQDMDSSKAPDVVAPVYLRAYPKIDSELLVGILNSFMQSEKGIKKDFANVANK